MSTYVHMCGSFKEIEAIKLYNPRVAVMVAVVITARVMAKKFSRLRQWMATQEYLGDSVIHWRKSRHQLTTVCSLYTKKHSSFICFTAWVCTSYADCRNCLVHSWPLPANCVVRIELSTFSVNNLHSSNDIHTEKNPLALGSEPVTLRPYVIFHSAL